MRRPVRGEDVRITSGFGVRRHPILQVPKMHTGVDWACATGTPIMAAGSGVIEEAGRKGEYGNYIRIRHANGYKTAYGHMSRFAPGVSEGVKVRQGQIIGFVGSTGLASGPHVHFEVLVNSSYVDPMSIQVPRERQLAGKQLADFQKERARIDDLMRRNPVSTRVATRGRGNSRFLCRCREARFPAALPRPMMRGLPRSIPVWHPRGTSAFTPSTSHYQEPAWHPHWMD